MPSDVSGAGRQNASEAGHKFVATQAAVHPGHLYVLQVFFGMCLVAPSGSKHMQRKIITGARNDFLWGFLVLLPKIDKSHESSKFRHPKLVSFLMKKF